MGKYVFFRTKLPSRFITDCLKTKPFRQTEIFGFYNMLSRDMLKNHTRGIYFTEIQQLVFDADRYVMQHLESENRYSYENQLSALVGYTVSRCLITLDQIDAICTYRDLRGLDPIPPRNYPDRFKNY